MTFISFCLRNPTYGIFVCILVFNPGCQKASESIKSNGSIISPSLLDYLIQNVCVDSSDVATSANPATCTNQRNIKIGEPVPYLRTDFGPSGARYQGVTSYPVTGTDGKQKILVGKHFDSGFQQQTYQYDFLMSRDGFDLIEIASDYISISRTSDGGCLDQRMSQNGWVLFTPEGNAGEAELPITITRLVFKSGCATTTSGTAYTIWNQGSTTYTSGNTHESIYSLHYAARNLTQTNNALEKFYFTKQFGFTRWEAWIPHQRCLNELGLGNRTADECSGAFTSQRCNSSTSATIGGQSWVRVDCRDSTNYQVVDTPFFPFKNTMASDQIQY